MTSPMRAHIDFKHHHDHHGRPRAISPIVIAPIDIAIARCFLLVWLNHVRMMSTFFDYGYNGQFNAVFVVTMIPLWVIWWLRVRRQLP